MALKKDVDQELTKTPFVVKKKMYRISSPTYPLENRCGIAPLYLKNDETLLPRLSEASL